MTEAGESDIRVVFKMVDSRQKVGERNSHLEERA